MKIVRDDLIPSMADAGLDATINALVVHQIELNTLVGQINLATGLDMTEDLLVLYIAERQAGGFLTDLKAVDGVFPRGQDRPVAPSGFGQSTDSIWFSTPVEGVYTARWCVNGSTKLTIENVDISVNRSVLKSSLGCISGDIVQLFLIDSNGIYGWWGRVTIE